MPITKQHNDFNGRNTTKETLYTGRVLRVEHTTESRNWSDTLDYSDHRSTKCTYALVYLGTEGKKPRHHWCGNRFYVNDTPWTEVESLGIGDRFAWVDCTNLFSDRCGYSLTPVADTMGDLLLHSGVAVYDELAAWEAFHKARIEAELAESQRQAAEAKAKEDAEKAEPAPETDTSEVDKAKAAYVRSLEDSISKEQAKKEKMEADRATAQDEVNALDKDIASSDDLIKKNQAELEKLKS